MIKLLLAILVFFIYNSTSYSQQHLVLAKVEGLSDQYIGEFILTEAYKYLGIDLTFTTLPAQRALKLSESGEIDGETQRITVIEKSFPTLIRVPTPISYVDLSVFMTKKNPF